MSLLSGVSARITGAEALMVAGARVTVVVGEVEMQEQAFVMRAACGFFLSFIYLPTNHDGKAGVALRTRNVSVVTAVGQVKPLRKHKKSARFQRKG